MADKQNRVERWHAGGCYCGLWETKPGTLEEQGVPRGYCGLCQVCGKPGHTLHFPGAVAFTGSWCKRHYYRVMLLHPLGSAGTLLWLALLAGVVVIPPVPPLPPLLALPLPPSLMAAGLLLPQAAPKARASPKMGRHQPGVLRRRTRDANIVRW